MTARLWFILAAMFIAGCGASTSILPEPFTRERADGKIPVKTELIRAQVRAELSGIPEGEAEVARWQAIEADYHSCRLSSKKAAAAAEEVFADCMANRGYIYMFPLDAEQLHNDIAFEMEKDPEKWQNQVVTATVATSPITITNAPPNATPSDSDSGGYAKYLLGIAAIGGIAAVAAGGGGGSGGSGGNNPSITPTPTMTMTMTQPPTTPTRYEVTSSELAAWHIESGDNSTQDHPTLSNGSWLIIIPVDEQGLQFHAAGLDSGSRVIMERQNVTRTDWSMAGDNGMALRGDYPARVDVIAWNALGREYWHDFSKINHTVVQTTLGGMNHGSALYPLQNGNWQVLFATRTDISRLSQLCAARWLGDYINANYRPNGNLTMPCNYPSNTSFSPDMRQVVYAAMADGFNQGVGIGESGFAFSGRYDDNNRAAGFTYDLGGYALRTDYTRLPSKQDGEVWLDTYRFGALTRINDEVRLYAGVDSYRNAIIAIDADDGNMHRLGFAIGDGYAVKYEYRLNL